MFEDFDFCDCYFLVAQQLAHLFLRELFEDIINRFCRIADNLFRKDILTKIRKIKTDRLRKQVDFKQPISVQAVNMKAFLNDKSEGKQSTHFKLKSGFIDDEKTLFSKFNKKELLLLCKVYDIIISSNSTLMM